MVRRKPPGPGKRVVWRISEAAPLGEFVDANEPSPSAPRNLPETSSGGWIVSSFELLHGADVTDASDTVPDDLFDEMFPAPRSSADKPPDDTE